MFDWIFKRRSRTSYKILQARYDAAQTTSENVHHWSMADGYSADAAMPPDIRRTLRNRSRYEVANNSYAKGIILTLAGDCIGTGPRLQMIGEGKSNNLIEDEFTQWSEAVNLASKLRTMRMARATDGEAFAVLINNPKVNHPVKLDLMLIEADRVTSSDLPTTLLGNVVDGIEYDKYGNPSIYHILRYHPGDSGALYGDYERVPSSTMLHWFRPDRPGQHRGIPEITPALPLFAQLRRYTLAVLAAAETAADFAAVLYTNAPPEGEAADVKPMDTIPLTKRMATTLPEGWQLGQVKAEHPSTTYSEFKREILCEIGRCLMVPINVVTGDSSKHNYASGRLDHQTYFREIRIDQSSCERTVMNPIFDAWIAEASLIPQFGFGKSPYLNTQNDDPDSSVHRVQDQMILPNRQSGGTIRHEAVRVWMWDGAEHVDPLKEAKAQSTRLTNLTASLATEYAKQGKDWELELRQIAKERELMKELGLVLETAPNETNTGDQEDEESEEGAG